ncbi:MAG: hypothetical protein V1720_03360 [bacterium]
MNKMNPMFTALKFNEYINAQDLNGLADLMTENHTFIDREGNIGQPKIFMIDGWRKFFEMFPDYKNYFTRVELKGDIVVIAGYAYWSEENPYDNVIWTARIENDLVAEWKIYYDTEENREKFKIE